MPSRSVLFIDDHPHLSALRKANLESRGYSVRTASSGSAGVKILERIPVDAVLLEYKLESRDAEAIAFHIKRQFPNLPIVLLSAFEEMPEGILWLVDEYAPKSAQPEELVSMIERVVARPAA